MNAQLLSHRLTRVAHYVPKDSVVADIGSDHAYLPCFLVLTGVINKAIAGEVVRGPFESAQKQVQRELLTNQIDVRLASGLDAIELNDGITTVTIAGMGGPLICSILEQGKEKLTNVERLILQPNVHSKAIRDWAVLNQWRIVEEEILKENDKIYEIIVLEKSPTSVSWSSQQLLMGPELLKKQNGIFQEKWMRESSQWKKIVASMESTVQTIEIIEKKQELVKKIQLVEEVLQRENS
ncbi:tRNA (adenine(22)-N(1))-methyltransferase [Planococcus versutus]|uniref:SAM-dependent methyltransferase n=1 Tax=Planococcus versutus TaxID=1302659 RepID=A0A1B1RX90_9BACL|nr:tRNA (adenine(22)-N(1))-methyltransferase TrmK [Planococcus versutus]ANU25549.1 SAM-dependent methyltransferase [Planococcus versutus]